MFLTTAFGLAGATLLNCVRGVLLCSLLLLAACGQSGDLYLPDEAPATPAPTEAPPGPDTGAPPPQTPESETLPPPADETRREPSQDAPR